MTKQLRDLLIDNIRKSGRQDDGELRQSLQSFGWVKELPAIADETGVVLVGHRRLRIAKELGIEPVIWPVMFGSGQEADANRVKLAIASNIGAKAMSRGDRKRIAEYLYGQREWTLQRIAQALGASTATIGRDLGGFSHAEKITPRRKTASNPNGAGRPKGSKRGTGEKHARARDIVRPMVERGEAIDAKELERKHDIANGTFEKAIAAEEAAKEARTDPVIDPAILSKTAKEKLDAAMRQHQKRLDAQFDARVSERIEKLLNETILPNLRAREQAASSIMKNRRRVMTHDLYRKILAALHPDSRKTFSDELLTDLRMKFEVLQVALVGEKELPTDDLKMPKSYDDLMAMRRQGRNGARA